MTAYRALSPEARRPGLELDDGQLIGRDPRILSTDELRALGHTPTPVLRAIRERCLDCCCEQPAEVRKCTAVGCPSWPFRMGTNPWRAPPSEERRAAAVEAGRRLASLRTIQGKTEPADQPVTAGASDGYDKNKDLAGSLEVGYEAIRARMAKGGPGWEPK
jgi:hypothetical protein